MRHAASPIDPVELHNATMLAAVREPDRDADALVWNMTRDLIGGRSLYDLTDQSGLEARGYRAVLRLIRIGALISQPGQRLTPETLVYRKGTIQ